MFNRFEDGLLRLVQLKSERGGAVNAVAVIEGDGLDARLVTGASSVLDLAKRAASAGTSLAAVVREAGLGEAVDLVAALEAGRIAVPVHHPDPAHFIVAGTGLTHLGSADGRDKMHKSAAGEHVTDSMKMFRMGLEGGKPAAGQIGVQPEWFYKGDGSTLVGPGDDLVSPSFALDGGEEPELAGIYLIGEDGTPYRLGFCLANEFSDHVTERGNYLWLAHSKLRQASLGPELFVGELPAHVEGMSRVRRGSEIVFEKPFLSGEANMSHSIANLEYHHFKYDLFCRPGDLHVHFFGTATLSVTDGLKTQDGDVFEIEAAPFRLPLRNRLARAAERPVAVKAL
ncbi:AraD1 family protein [Antarcticirhabdus aurantiaca]|uniref:GguC family protein n=1 Tax=Antarcticirhabdus aurantiaca TaxID=2606717 RepID=A0ACD4NLJ3_9HYPH|nr:AraD1 family protein [Antarcticirhabdus aurantiaca]WAJ27647.1 GguC family protein [Jeongeuplla avenae]